MCIDTFKEDRDAVYEIERTFHADEAFRYKVYIMWTVEEKKYELDLPKLEFSMEFAGVVVHKKIYPNERPISIHILNFYNDCDIKMEEIADGTTAFERSLLMEGFEKL